MTVNTARHHRLANRHCTWQPLPAAARQGVLCSCARYWLSVCGVAAEGGHGYRDPTGLCA